MWAAVRETTAEEICQLSEVREKLVADLRTLTETSQQEAEQLKQVGNICFL